MTNCGGVFDIELQNIIGASNLRYVITFDDFMMTVLKCNR